MIFPAISRRHVVRYKGQTADILTMLKAEKFDGDDKIKLLEQRFAEFIGVQHALAVSSGRVSLEAILNALEFPQKGEVILPAYTYHSVPDAIRNAGLVPVFADIDPLDNNLSPEKVEEKIGPNTVAVLATHIFGHPCRVDKLDELCEKSGAVLLEDCAHTLGGTFNGKQVGSFGKAGFFSFGATKTFNTYGGGMITTDDDELAVRIRRQLDSFRPPDKKGLVKTIFSFSMLHYLTKRWPFSLMVYPALWLINSLKLDLLKIYGSTFKKTAESISVPVRYSNLQAALALKQLDFLAEQNARRKENAETLLANLKPEIKRLQPVKGAESVWYFFAIGVKDREIVANALYNKGLDTGKHIMEDCAKLAGITEPFPETEWWYEHSVQIPIHPPLGPSDMKKVADVINEVVDG